MRDWPLGLPRFGGWSVEQTRPVAVAYPLRLRASGAVFACELAGGSRSRSFSTAVHAAQEGGE